MDIVIAKLPTTRADKLSRATIIEQKLATTTYLTNALALRALLSAALQDSILKHAGYQAKPPQYTKAEVETSFDALELNVANVVNAAQLVVNNNADKAQLIVDSVGLFVRKQSTPKRSVNVVITTEEENTYVVIAEDSGVHEWRMSKDDETTWATVHPTTGAKLIVHDLEKGVQYYFQYRKVMVNNQMGPWSESIKYKVV